MINSKLCVQSVFIFNVVFELTNVIKSVNSSVDRDDIKKIVPHADGIHCDSLYPEEETYRWLEVRRFLSERKHFLP